MFSLKHLDINRVIIEGSNFNLNKNNYTFFVRSNPPIFLLMIFAVKKARFKKIIDDKNLLFLHFCMIFAQFFYIKTPDCFNKKSYKNAFERLLVTIFLLVFFCIKLT